MLWVHAKTIASMYVVKFLKRALILEEVMTMTLFSMLETPTMFEQEKQIF